MKRLVMMTVALSIFAQVSHAEVDRNDGDVFYGIDKNKAHTQALMGAGEGLVASILAYQALKGGPKLVAPKGGSVGDAVRASRENYKLLDSFRKSKGKGLIRSVKFLGASILFVDMSGRIYEWMGTDAEPHWSPVYSFLATEQNVPVEEMPEAVIPTNPADSMTIPQMSSEDQSLEAQLREKLNSRLAKVNAGYASTIQAELGTVEARIQSQKQEIQDAHARKDQAHADFQAAEANRLSSERFDKATGNFYKSRPTAEDKQTAQQVLFGGELMGSTILLRSLFTKEGAKAVAEAEAVLARAKDLSSVKNSITGVIPNDDGVVARTRAIAVAEQNLAAGKMAQEIARRTPGVDAATLAKTDAQIARLEKLVKNLKAGTVVSKALKAQLVKIAESNLAETRALAIRTSKAAPLLKSVKVVGSMVLIADAIGRGYQWYSQDADPQFAPGVTWALLKAEPHFETARDAIQTKVVEPSGEFLKARFEEFKKDAQERRDSGLEPMFPRGPKL